MAVQRLIQGNYKVRLLELSMGTNPNKNNRPEVNAKVIVVEGPDKDSTATYQGTFTEKQIKWTLRDLRALGWKGKTIATVVADCMTDPKIVDAEIEIASHTYPDSGKTSEWSAVRAFGRKRMELGAPTPATIKDVDEWLAEAAKEDNDPVPF